MKIGQFNTSAAALQKRIKAHEKYGSSDLNEWIFEHLNLKNSLSVLEIGSGIGKQSLPIAQRVGQSGVVLATDISREALEILQKASQKLKFEKQLHTLLVDLDFLTSKIKKQKFDRILASFSLYYTRNPQALFRNLQGLLEANGFLFFCGPSQHNNEELKKFHLALDPDQQLAEAGGAIFMEKVGQEMAYDFFSKVEVFTFENTLQFNSAAALYQYWSSYNLYDVNLDAGFRKAAQQHFKKHSKFKTVKRIIGIKATK